LVTLGFSQTKTDTISSTIKVGDTLIDGKTTTLGKEIPAEKDTLNIKNLKDHPEAAELDQKWLEELYSNSLYDTIYKSVTELTYEPVDYPELSTDTLKARLARLNAKTPFNIEYNPSLESVIKRYLKHRRTSLERLMGLSHFYFPMFEAEFDNYNIPLEMKYLSIVESALKPKARCKQLCRRA
jgi:membrane-bound lytic murein transglycosylase D